MNKAKKVFVAVLHTDFISLSLCLVKIVVEHVDAYI